MNFHFLQQIDFYLAIKKSHGKDSSIMGCDGYLYVGV